MLQPGCGLAAGAPSESTNSGWLEVPIYTVILILQRLVECLPESSHCAGYECMYVCMNVCSESSGVWNL